MRFTYRAAGPITRPILGLGRPGRSRRFIAAAAVLTLLAGCSRTQHDWRAAQQAGTPQAYLAFVRRHPDSELAGVARQRIAQLTEETAWRQATRANTAAAYQGYLARYPNGSWAQDARIRMESRSLAEPAGAEPASTPATPAPAPAPAPAAEPTAAPATAAHASPAAAAVAGDGARHAAVQLGAFSSSAAARVEWRQLSSKFRPQLAGLTARVVPVVSSGRRLYRLQADVTSQAAARRLCRQLQQQSQACLPLP